MPSCPYTDGITPFSVGRTYRTTPAILAALFLTVFSASAFATEPVIEQQQTYSISIPPGPVPATATNSTILASFSFDDGDICSTMGWQSVDLTGGLGDFAGLGRVLLQQDPCFSDLSCVWGFFHGSTTDYACGGGPAQAAVPMGTGGLYLNNEIWSPLIPLSGQGSTFLLSFNVYRDMPLANLVFYGWRIRSYAGGVPGEWRDTGTLYYGGDKDWLHVAVAVGALIDPGASHVQIALGTRDLCGLWCGTLGDGACHSHAPLIDDVQLVREDPTGPAWSVRHVDLFQDNFASDGTTTGSVRADAALDILPRSRTDILPGDSVCVTVSAPAGLDHHMTGDAASGPAVYTYVAVWPQGQEGKSGPDIEAPEMSAGGKRFPLTDSLRQDNAWWYCFRMDSCRTGGGVAAPNRFCFDMRDDLFTPGDTVCYFFGARDAVSDVTYWSRRLSGQGQGFVTLDRFEALASPLEFTCLPAGGWRRGGDILYVDDADDQAGPPQVTFDNDFQLLGIDAQVDRYDVLGASSLANNSPASRVRDVLAQLAGPYNRVLWHSGTRSDGVLGDGSGRPLKTDDFGLLYRFLDEPPLNTGLYLSGDNIASNWMQRGGSAAMLRQAYMGFDLVSASHMPEDVVSPKMRGTGILFSHVFGTDSLVAYGGCAILNTFDVLEATGRALVEMRSEAGYGYVVRQSTFNSSNALARVIMSGFSYDVIRDAGPQFPPARVEHLKDILVGLYDPPCPIPVGPPCEPSVLSAEPVAQTIELDWNLGPCALPLLAFNLYREKAGGERQQVATLPAEVDAFIDDEVEPRTLYTYTLGIVVDTDRIQCPGPSVLEYVFDTVRSNPQGINRLEQNVPNPFRPTTSIAYSLEADAHVILRIYDVQGRLVRTLVDEQQPAIEAGYTIDWDGTNNEGNHVPSGVYFYKIVAGGFEQTRKMVVVR